MASPSFEFKAPLVAYNTVLVLIPPPEITYRLNPFRRVHDKAGIRWTTHITMMCPFVEEVHLPDAVERLRAAVGSLKPFRLRLDKVDKFSMKGYDTVHLTVSQKEDQEEVQQLWKVMADILGYNGRAFIPHLTVGQAPNRGNTEALQLLLSKAEKILESVKDIDWTVGSVVALKKDEDDGGIMKFNDEIFLEGYTETLNHVVSELPTVSYAEATGWSPYQPEQDLASPLPTNVSIATYNLLHDQDFPISERINRLVEQIVATDADILSLQEVSDEFLGLLLSSPVVRSTYVFSSRDPAVVLENERNVVILSKFAFDSSKVDVGGKHKPSALAVFDQSNIDASESKRLVVAAVHLTAGRAASPLEQKTRELTAIVDHLKANYPEDDWIIAGDLNWPNEIVATPADDLFIDAGDTTGHQATYDPTRNYLAAKTARESRDGQRYDRIYIKRNGSWRIKRVDVFGVDENPVSDHWCLLSVLEQSSGMHEGNTTSRVAEQNVSFTETTEASSLPSMAKFFGSDLETLMLSEGWYPTQEHESNMEAALALVREVICATGSPSGSNTSKVIIRIEPVGSYALGMHTTASDIDCVAVGNVSPRTFWMLARSRIRSAFSNVAARDARSGLRLRRFVKDAIVQMMELEAFGVKIDLQYCAAAKLAECWDDVPNLPTDSPLFNLPVSSLVTLNAYRDVLTLKRVLPSVPTFRVAHRALKHLLTLRGFSGARFGFLGGFHLTLLLTRVALLTPSSAKPHHLVEAFLQIYSRWDWERDIAYPIPTQNSETMPYKRVIHKEPMVILSIERPLANLASHASRNSVEALSCGLKHAYDMLKEGNSWSELCGVSGADTGDAVSPLNDFLSSHKAFIRLNIHLWGGNGMKARATIGYLESRFVHILIQLRLAAPELTVRFWPSRLVDESTVDMNARDPNGIYLFGLTPSNTSASTRSREGIEASLSNCLRTFESDLRANERYYDENDTFISLEIVKRSKLPSNIILDPFVWPDNGIDTVDDDEGAESEDEENANLQETSNALDMWEESQPLSSAQRKRALAVAKSSRKTTHIPAAKLRTSTDVYNRLLWDMTGDVTKDGYMIGYEDRFKGVKEMPLTSWKREVEDESFIPFHRVVYFKRVFDGVYVWDRRAKVDLVFGSGVGAG